MEQESRSNGASATPSKQAADNTSRIKSVHVLGLLALNCAPVEKTDVPSNAMSPLSAWAVKINAMDTGMPSRASSSASDFSTPSVADSVEFTETNPAGVIDKEAPVKDTQAPVDTVMNDTESESEIEEISAGGVLSVPLNQVCIFHFLKTQLFVF
jgi:hypothetical protein